MLRLIQTRAFLSNDNWMRRMQQSVCERVFQTRSVCRNALFSITAATNKHHFNAVLNYLLRATFIARVFANVLLDSRLRNSSRRIIRPEFPSTLWRNSPRIIMQVLKVCKLKIQADHDSTKTCLDL